MELREIGIDDVYPDEKNPRKDFGDIAALAESCMLNALNPGEPVNPIVVVEDGGIYRIVDGERRYKAMCKNKLARCHAVVCLSLIHISKMHGATRDEVISAVLIGLPAVGNVVTASLPAVLEAYDEE